MWVDNMASVRLRIAREASEHDTEAHQCVLYEVA